MKWQAVIVLITIMIGIVAPPSILLATADGGQLMIGTLDVCHSPASVLSPNSTTRCVHESAHHLSPPAFELFAEIIDSDVSPFSLSFPYERPPKS